MGSNLAVPSNNAKSSSSSSIRPVPTTTRVESRCVPRTEKGTLSFEVTGYRQVKVFTTTIFISSSSIEVGGYSWCLRYYPDGDSREESKGFAGLYLELLTKNVVVKALYEFRLVDLTKGAPFVIHQFEVPETFNTVDASKNQNAWGVGTNKYLKRRELEASVYLRDDRLVIECEITVVNEPLVVETMRTTSAVEALHRNLSRDFANLLESKEGADMIFEVQGEVIAAHTVVLAARSPVFKAQFYGPLKQKIGESHVTVQDMQPAVFKALLYFIYANAMSPCIGSLNGHEKEELTKHLLVAGDRYDVEGMRSVCETKLCESLDVLTVATTLAFADQNNCAKLKDACIEFMVSNIKLEDLFKSNGYEDLKSSCPAVFIDLYERKSRASKV